MLGRIATVLVLASAVLPARAADQVIGDWFVQVEKDPFSPKKKTFAALMESPAMGFALRCLGDDGLSAVIIFKEGTKEFDTGQKVEFKYRADEGEIYEGQGEAFGDHMIDLPIPQRILNDAEKANNLYFRMETPVNTSVTMSFKTRGAAKALSGIKTDCATVPDTKGAK